MKSTGKRRAKLRAARETRLFMLFLPMIAFFLWRCCCCRRRRFLNSHYFFVVAVAESSHLDFYYISANMISLTCELRLLVRHH